jgi:signal transduction histidine kinase/ActR/RegA family two-component response regulator
MSAKSSDGERPARIESPEDAVARKMAANGPGDPVKAASKRWQDTFNAMSEAIAVLDSDCRILQCNQAMLQLLDKPESDIVGKYCWQAVHGSESRIPSCPCPSVNKNLSRETVTIDYGERNFEVAMDPQLDEENRICGYIHIMSDVTARKQSETALHEARNTLVTILDSIDATIYVADIETYQILFMNRHMREAFGGDFTGEKCWQAFRQKEGPCPDCTNAKLLDAQGQPTGACVWEARNSSTGRWYVNYDRAIKWIDGRYVRLQVATDITEIKSLEKARLHSEAQLRQAQKMEAIGTLAGGIAHDFNNILSAILGYSELALDDTLTDCPSSAHYIREILKAGGRARDLVHQILTFSRQTETEAKPIQVRPIVKEALKLLRASLPSTIEIETDIQSKAIVEADPIQIHQVIMNLCTNAGHAMRPKGGRLKVALTEERVGEPSAARQARLAPGEYLRISVSDTGPGIAPEIMDKIFDPYFTTKQQGEGTGMGLSVVQGIVQNCGGAILVTSPPGQGACFNIYLPVIHMEEPAQPHTEIVIPGGHERILFVDDEPALADLSKQILERMGYQVAIRTSSIEALALFESTPNAFDLVITDMTMPHMAGDLLAEKLLALDARIPIIICTGYSERITQDIIERLKIRALIMKPIIRNEMLLTVRQVLDDSKEG